MAAATNERIVSLGQKLFSFACQDPPMDDDALSIRLISQYENTEGLLQRACARVAYVMMGMLEDYDSSDTRLLAPPLIPDDLVLAGHSICFLNRSPEDGKYREHVVPRIIICNEAHALLRSGKPAQEVGVFIAAHLKIVLITKYEAALLNKSMRQTMPQGWRFGDDPFARLRVAGIAYELMAQLPVQDSGEARNGAYESSKLPAI